MRPRSELRRVWWAIALAIAGLALSAPSAGALAHRWGDYFGAPGQIVLTSGGQFAYVADDRSILALRRNPQTGALSLIDSYDGGGAAMTLSSDGGSLYLIGPTPEWNMVKAFKRDPQTGALTESGSWQLEPYGQPTDILSFDAKTLYVSDPYRDRVVVLTRDPATGRLSVRQSFENGENGVEKLTSPNGMELSPDRKWLYVANADLPLGVAAFRVADDGSLTSAPEGACSCESGADLVMTSDGRRLVSGIFGPGVQDRDPETGALTARPTTRVASSGSPVADGALAIAPGDAAIYATDFAAGGLLQFANGGDVTLRRIYRPGRDGQGLAGARAVAVAPGGDHVLVTGGGNWGAPGTVGVYRRDPATDELTFASLFMGPYFDGRPHDRPGTEPTVTINGGAEYTNDPDVHVAVAGLSQADFELEISNDGGFAPSSKRPGSKDTTFPWTLATSGPELLPKWVYVRVLGANARYAGRAFADDILLDQRPPTLEPLRLVTRRTLRATSAAPRLRIEAHDNLSGVRQLQITRDRTRPGAWRPFQTVTAAPAGTGKVYVRVRDGARNRSMWRGVATG